MKQLFTLLVYAENSAELENILNKFRIGLNEWDKTRVFDYQGCKVINYTIICEEATFTSILDTINTTQAY